MKVVLFTGIPQQLRRYHQRAEAARAGRISADDKRVILETPLGGERFLEELEDDPLPRIC